MNYSIEPADDAFDQSLRRFANHIELPAEPTAEQQQAWTRGKAPPRRRRGLAWFGGGTAMAACLAIGAMLFINPAQPRVQAAMIFASMNEALSRAFRLTLNQIPDGHDGALNGEITVAFDPLNGGEESDSVFCEGWQRSDVVAGEPPPIDVQFAFAGLPDEAWVYVKTAAIPEALVADSALKRLLVNWARGGVLIDLSGLRKASADAMAAANGRNGSLKVIRKKDALREVHKLFGHDPANGKLHLEIGMSAGSPPKEEENPPVAHPPIFSFSLKTGESPDAEANASSAAVKDVNLLAAKLLHGRAGAADVRHLLEILQQSATQVTVEAREPGVHVMIARDFRVEDEWLQKWLTPQTTYSITYREGHGVESAMVENIGQTGGSIRFETIDFAYDPATHGRPRYAKDGQTHVLDFAALLKAVEPFFSSDPQE